MDSWHDYIIERWEKVECGAQLKEAGLWGWPLGGGLYLDPFLLSLFPLHHNVNCSNMICFNHDVLCSSPWGNTAVDWALWHWDPKSVISSLKSSLIFQSQLCKNQQMHHGSCLVPKASRNSRHSQLNKERNPIVWCLNPGIVFRVHSFPHLVRAPSCSLILC